ncbi:hypothetical protein [Streptomyces antibioticus]|uniref:hypothetical protein n=1 Tax=Streptomyces antibioticus TaxID=1890 RepID=UPI0033DD108C
MTTTTDPRIAVLSALNDPPYNETAEKRCVPWDDAVKLLDGNDARAILGIVWKWIADANDGLGSDVGDLQHELETAGYGPLSEASNG